MQSFLGVGVGVGLFCAIKYCKSALSEKMDNIGLHAVISCPGC